MKKGFMIFTFALLFIILNWTTVKAGTQEIKNLEFTVDVKENGDMVITEIWSIYISETNTVFKTFASDGSYENITDVRVSEIKDGNKSSFFRIDTYQYHVKKFHFQALENPDGMFEIAWGVGLDNSSATRTYEVSYTVKNHVALYTDGAQVYWQLIGKDYDTIKTKKINGIINIPEGITNKEDLKVWAHGPLNGSINIDSVTQVSFSVDDLRTRDFLEIRLIMPTSIFKDSSKIKDASIINKAIEEETVWANEANARREKHKIIGNIIKGIGIILIIANIVLIGKLIQKLTQTEKKRPEQKLKYFRDITNENVSPAQAAFLSRFSRGKISSNVGRVISATVLSLTLKKWLEIEVDEKDKKEVTFIFKEEGEKLTKSEELIFDFLKKASKDKKELKLKELEKYIKKQSMDVYKITEKLSDLGEKENVECKNFELKLKKDSSKWWRLMWGYIVLVFIVFCIIAGISDGGIIGNIVAGGLYMGIITTGVINIILLLMIASRKNGLTVKRNK